MTLVHQIRVNDFGLVIPDSFKINAIRLNPGMAATWIDEAGHEAQAGCLDCVEKTCIAFSESEISHGMFNDLPLDRVRDACASKAIKIDDQKGGVSIDADLCVLCGVCAERCQAKAIFLTDDTAVVASSDLLEKSPDSDAHSKSIAQLHKAVVSGIYLFPTDKSALRILAQIKQIKPRTDIFSPNRLVRNILTTLGWPAGSYNQGVQYSNIDVVANSGETRVVAEIEIGAELLDTARNLMTASAMLFDRHHWPKKQTELISVGLSIPNKRTDYWNVLEDIASVLGMHVKTITLPALIYLVWLRGELDLASENFILDADNPSIRYALPAYRKFLVGLTQGFGSILEPPK